MLMSSLRAIERVPAMGIENEAVGGGAVSAARYAARTAKGNQGGNQDQGRGSRVGQRQEWAR